MSSRTRSKISLTVSSEMSLLRLTAHLQTPAGDLRQAKKAPKVFCGSRRELLRRQVSHSCERPRYFGDKSRLVALPAKRLWREKRRIGLDQYRFERQRGGNIAQILRLRISRVSREGNHESHFCSTAGFFERTAEAVEDSAKAG